jgi:hypothetical protein
MMSSHFSDMPVRKLLYVIQRLIHFPTLSACSFSLTALRSQPSMAIIGELPGLKVDIVVDCVPLQEYADDDEPPTATATTKYIESRTGNEIAIRCTFSPPFAHGRVGVNIGLDGNSCVASANYATQPLHQPVSHIKDSFKTAVGACWLKQKFIFAALDFSKLSTIPWVLMQANIVGAEDAPKMSKSAMKKVSQPGMIEVVLQDCGPQRIVTGLSSHIPYSDDVGVTPEKVVKGDAKSHKAGQVVHSHGSTCADECRLTGPEVLQANNGNYRTWDLLGGPFATFRFKYRSHGKLIFSESL